MSNRLRIPTVTSGLSPVPEDDVSNKASIFLATSATTIEITIPAQSIVPEGNPLSQTRFFQVRARPASAIESALHMLKLLPVFQASSALEMMISGPPVAPEDISDAMNDEKISLSQLQKLSIRSETPHCLAWAVLVNRLEIAKVETEVCVADSETQILRAMLNCMPKDKQWSMDRKMSLLAISMNKGGFGLAYQYPRHDRGDETDSAKTTCGVTITQGKFLPEPFTSLERRLPELQALFGCVETACFHTELPRHEPANENDDAEMPLLLLLLRAIPGVRVVQVEGKYGRVLLEALLKSAEHCPQIKDLVLRFSSIVEPDTVQPGSNFKPTSVPTSGHIRKPGTLSLAKDCVRRYPSIKNVRIGDKHWISADRLEEFAEHYDNFNTSLDELRTALLITDS